jgi:uncharacterized membrane protein (DUF485 family)
MEGDIIMSDSAKLRMCYGIISLIVACLLLSAFVCSIWLAVLIDSGFVLLSIFSILVFLITIVTAVQYFIWAGNYMKSNAESDAKNDAESNKN